jgi:2-C-methyl-D-erythritol 4-phosphate cytidylyltransferase
LLENDLIERVLAALNEGWDGAVPGLPLSDTVKRVDGDRVVETLPREALRAVQTPQAFVASVLREAYSAGDVRAATDCSSLVEARGGRVKVVEGDPKLIKVTEADDLERVAALL